MYSIYAAKRFNRDYAFYECENLHHINIPDGMIKIGFDVFYKCIFYDDVIVPD